ncbi:MAG: hypothetical protein CVU88_01315 [Firmicutes bacterium HGW-Firmicutes-13]|nr:MAG: hypothetical protein CVU88_01315 [Firmicutes bacterium HGW-Firmicutes-13]
MEERFAVYVDNLRLKGSYFVPPHREKKKFPAVCFCHGIPGKKRVEGTPGSGYEDIARRFREEGFAAFIFNFRGTGDSEGNFDLLSWTEDLAAIVNFITNLPEVDDRKINLIGFSGGGAAALYHAVRNAGINSVILGACPAHFDFLINENNLEEVLKNSRDLGIIRDLNYPPDALKWMNRVLSLRPEKEISRLSPRPVLIIHGMEDELVPVSHAHQLHKAAFEPKELILIEGAGHRLRNNRKVIDTCLEWLKNLLRQS